MAAQNYEQICKVCGETVTGDMQVHLVSKCKGDDSKDKLSDDEPIVKSSTKTVRVRFMFKPLSTLSFRTVTLLSAFNSVDLTSNGMNYTSEYTDIPMGEFDGQLILGSSYCYPLKKFMIDEEGETVLLEMDPKRMESDLDTYSTGATAGIGAAGRGTAGRGTAGIGTADSTIRIQYNPSYQITEGGSSLSTCPIHGTPLHHDIYEDSVGGAYGGGTYATATSLEGSGQKKMYAVLYYSPNREDTYITPVTSPRAITEKQKVSSESPPSSDNEFTTPSTGKISEEFSRQLSAEGFSPAKVKSKASMTSNTSLQVNSKQSITASLPSSLPTTKKPHTTSHVRVSSSIPTSNVPADSTGFSIADIQSNVDLTALQEENTRLKANLERVSAQWEGRVKRLETKLKQHGIEASNNLPVEFSDERLSELEETIEQLRSDIQEKENELDMKEKELVESKDRVTALENQMVEYATIMNEQSKVIQSSQHQTSHHTAQVHDLYQKAMEYSKKQQVEFQEKLSTLEARIIEVTKANEDTVSLHEIMNQLKLDVEDYRIQTKGLLKEISDKDNIIQMLEEKLKRSRSTTSELEALEVETLHDKCEAWQKRAEDLSKEVEEMKSLLSELASQKLQAEENLAHHLEMSSSEMLSRQQLRLEESNKQTKELQEMRVKMEADLHQLRSERTQILEHNAQLIESCDPERYNKLKKDFTALQYKLQEKEQKIKEIQEKLEFHTASNQELKEHLESAMNEEMLRKIEQRISKYKKERDVAKENVKLLKMSHEEQLLTLKSQHESLVMSLQQELKVIEEEKNYLMKKVEEYKVKKKTKHQELKKILLELEERNAYINQLEQDQLHQKMLPYSYRYDEDDIDDDDTFCKKKSLHSEMDIYLPPVETPRLDISLEELSLDQEDHPPSLLKRDSKFQKGDATYGQTRPSSTKPLKQTVARKMSLGKLVTVKTKSGEQELPITRLLHESVEVGTPVVVKRTDGSYYMGTLRYVGYSDKGGDLCGIELDVPRIDGNGKANDGTYRDGIRYFYCDEGHGLYTLLAHVYEITSL